VSYLFAVLAGAIFSNTGASHLIILFISGVNLIAGCSSGGVIVNISGLGFHLQ